MTTENHSHAAHVVFQQRGSCLVAKLLWHRIESPDVAGAVGRSLTQALKQQGSAVQMVRLDFDSVQQISSIALKELIGFRNSASRQGLSVEISKAKPHIREVFMITRLDRVFSIAENEALT